MKKRSLTYFGMLLLGLLIGFQSYAQVNHPASGSGAFTETLGAGGFVDYYDQGGPAGNYSTNNDNTSASQTFAPSDATTMKVVANFDAFQTENAWDGMFVYDGNSTAATQISSGITSAWNLPFGAWSGTNSPNGGIVDASSADGSLTFSFFSDASVTCTGWAACVTEIDATVSLTGCTITAPADQLNLSTDAAVCSATLTTALPVSSCSATAGAFFSYSVDGGTAVDVNQPYPGSVIIPGLAAGDHEILWTINLGTACGPIELASATQNIFVADLVPPVVVCPADMTIDLNPGLCCQIVSFDVTASDNCPFLVPAAPLAVPGSNSNGQDGIQFDVRNDGTSPIEITSWDIRISAGNHPVEVYVTNGNTAIGVQNNAGAWTLLGTATITTGAGFAVASATANVPVGGLTLAPGASKGIYITGIGPSIVGYSNGNLTTTDGSLAVVSNNHRGGTYPFGSQFTPRQFHGGVNYSISLPSDDLPVDQTAGLPSGTELCADPGFYTNSFSAVDAQGNVGTCSFNITVNDFQNATQNLTCNDNVQVSLDQSCNACIGADQILEGGPYGCYDTRYDVMVLSPLGAPLGECVGNNMIGGPHVVKVTDNQTGQSCWGSIIVEDKLPPVLVCNDFSVPCTEDIDLPEFVAPSPALFQPATPVQSPASFVNHGGGVAFTLQGNTAAGGVYFDVTNNTGGDVQITGFGIRYGNPQFGQVNPPQTMEVWTAPTFVGNETDPAAWENLGPQVVEEIPAYFATGTGDLAQLPIANNVDIPAGETRGFHIWSQTSCVVFNYTFSPTTPQDVGGFSVQGGPVSFGLLSNLFQAGNGSDPNIQINYAVSSPAIDPTDNCGPVTLDYEESFIDDSCGGPSGTVVRSWSASDPSGNTSTCQQTITYDRPTLDDVDAPLDIKWSCVQYDIFPNITNAAGLHPYLVDCDIATEETIEADCYNASCDDTDIASLDREDINSTTTGGGCPGNGLDDADVLALTGSGYPTVGGKPLANICEIGVEYEDIVVTVCEGTFKIVRQWTLIDWCANPVDVRQINQVIKVVDEEAPIIELFGVDGLTSSNYGNTAIPALGNLGNPNTTGGCGQAPQNTGGTVFTAHVQLPGTGQQFNPDMFTNIRLESVLLSISHEHVEDLDIFLKGPSNKVIELSTDNGLNGVGYYNTKFVDDATVPSITAANSPFTGHYRPEGSGDISCGGFAGTVATLAEMSTNWQADVLGTWELIVFDDDEDNIGEMIEWKLNFSFGDVLVDVYNAQSTNSIHTVCEGAALVPPIQDCTDNCSGVESYVTELWTRDAAGNPVTQIGTIAGNGGYFDNVPMYENGLPARYIVRYYAIDYCKNQAFVDMNVSLRDKVPPVVVCDEITEVSITNNGQGTGSSCSTLYAEDLDDGSYDNCAPVYFLMAKMDDTNGTNIYNRCYYPSRDFCCDNIGDNTVIVLVLDQDPSQFFSTSPTSASLGCAEPTPQTPKLFLSPSWNRANYNTCMVNVQVTDKLPPVLISCPPNERISCDLYASNLETQLENAADQDEQCDILSMYFGTASYFDNCTVNTECTVSVALDQCLEGRITRRWTATDDAGNNNTSQNCNQTIFVDHVSDFVVEFPDDIDVECGNDVPDFGEPEIFYESCELVAVSYEDEVFTDEPGACYKIVRQWTVINWCVVGDEIDQEVVEDSELAMRLAGCLSIINLECDLDGDGDCDDRTFRDSWSSCTLPAAPQATQSTNPDTDSDSDPWDGFITYQQVIKVEDSVDPVFTNGCQIDDICILDNTCAASILLEEPTIDECSPWVDYDFTIVIGGVSYNGAGPYLNVAPGTYPVRIVASDNCNNQTACETSVTVADCKKPTPYCKPGIVVELMVVDPAMVEVWASDLNDNSFDNCPGALKYSFSSNVNNTAITFTCDDEGSNTVEMWVTDAAGNQDFCITTIVIQANMDQCDDDPSVVAGVTANEAGAGVKDVSVNINSPSGFDVNVTTDINGMYTSGVQAGGDYSVTPVYDVDPLNGVSTYDLVLISKHVLNIDQLDSPYKMIAADANKSGTITTFDMVVLRKLILFIDTEFANNTSWRFIDKSFAFANPANPFASQFPEVININNFSGSQLNTDFVAVKVGDVNGNASVNFGDTEDRNMVGDLVLNLNDVVITEGETYTVDFNATDFAVSGYQFSLNFDRNALDFVEVVSGLATEANFGLTMVNEGVITTSWNSNEVKTLATNDVVFGLTFTAKQSGRLSNMLNINSRYTVAEAYTADADLLNVALSFNNTLVADGFELYQNTPNPFATNTTIGFYLPEATSATLTISDVQGKVITVIDQEFVKGYNQVDLKRSDLGATGVLYYRLDTDTDSATRMMILVD